MNQKISYSHVKEEEERETLRMEITGIKQTEALQKYSSMNRATFMTLGSSPVMK